MSSRRRTTQEIQRLITESAKPILRAEARLRIRDATLSAFSHMPTDPPIRTSLWARITTYPLPSYSMLPIILAAVILFAGTGTVIASDAAKPGDPLYGVDRAIESIRMNFTLSDTAKAKFEVSRAQEREEERLLAGDDDGDDAEEHVNRALVQAENTLERVTEKQSEKGNERAQQTLTNVSLKLSELRARHEARVRETLQIEVRTRGNATTVEVRGSGIETTFTLGTADLNTIVAAIVERTGLAEADIRAVMDVEAESGDDSSEDEDEDRDAGANINTGVNLNLNVGDDSSDDDEDKKQNEDSSSRSDDDEDEPEDRNSENENGS